MADRTPHRDFGPHVPALAGFMVVSTVAPTDSLSFLTEVDRRWPDLSFRDFMAARVLAAALVIPTEGTA